MTTPKEKRAMQRTLHRIRQARLAEEMSLRSVARTTKRTVSDLKVQEQATSDVTLSELYDWQYALRVPATELLSEPDVVLAEPVRTRAALLRTAKTAQTLLQYATEPKLRRLVRSLIDQLAAIMPEVREQKPWHEIEVRKSTE